MTKTTLFIFLSALSGLGLSSCKSYYIPVDNFQKLFNGKGPADLKKEVTIRGPQNEKLAFKTYSIDSINCVDQKGNQVILESTPTLKIEIIFSNNEKSVFNFQTIRVNNNQISLRGYSKEETYYDMLSPINTRQPGDTLSKLEMNRARSSFYVYGDASSQNRRNEIPLSEIKKITVLQK